MPKVDLSHNTDVIKAQINTVNEKMRISTEQIANQRIALTRLEAEYQKLAERNDAYSSAKNKFEEINTAVNETKQRIAQLKSEMHNAPSLKIGAQMLSELTNLKLDLDEMESALQKAEENLKKFGKGVSVNALTSLEQKITDTKFKLSSLDASLSTHGAAKTGLEQQLDNISNKATQVSNQTTEVKSGVKQVAEGANKLKEISKSYSQISIYAKKASSSLSSFGGVAKKVIQFGSNPLSGMKRGLDAITGSSKKASKGMGGAQFSASRLIKSFVTFSLIFPLVSRGITALGQSIGSTLMTNETFKTSLDQIKSNLMAAFMPIYNAVLPALNALMSALATVTAYIASFVSTIFGSTYQASIDAAKGMVSAKDAVGAYGSAAKKAAKDANASVMAFDHLNKLNGDNEDNDSSGSKAPNIIPTDIDTSKVDGWAKKIKDMFKAGDYEGIGKMIGDAINVGVSKITDFISWDNVGGQVTKFCDGFTRIFNSTVKAIKWSAVGEMFGAGINTIVNTLYLLLTGIDWKGLGNSLGTGLNGMITTINWGKLGATIGSYFQAWISGLYGLVTSFNWARLGQGLADGLMGCANSIDFGMLGSLIGNGVRGAVSTVHNFITGIDWSALGQKIASTINNFFGSIDWADLGLTLSDAALGLLNLLSNALANVNWMQIGTDVGTFLINIDWIGVILSLADVIVRAVLAIGEVLGTAAFEVARALFDGLWNGITEFFADPGKWIKEKIVDPFVNWFKSLFGIHSPSTVMAEMGSYLIQGMIDGISNLIPNLLSSVGNWFGGIGSKISETWNDVKSWTSETWGNVKSAVSNKVAEVASNIGSGFSNAKDAVVTKCSEIKNSVSEKFGQVSSFLGGLKDDFFGKAKNAFDSFCGGVKSVDVKNAVSGVIDNAVSGLKNLGSSALKWGSDMVQGMASGIKSAGSWISNAVGGVADKITSFLHFSRPDKGPLREYETWMPDMLQGLGKTLEAKTPTLIGSVKKVAKSVSDAMQTIDKPQLAFAGSATIEEQYNAAKNTNSPMVDIMRLLSEIIALLKSNNETGSSGTVTPQEIIIKLGDTELARIVINALKKYEKETGKRVLV